MAKLHTELPKVTKPLERTVLQFNNNLSLKVMIMTMNNIVYPGSFSQRLSQLLKLNSFPTVILPEDPPSSKLFKNDKEHAPLRSWWPQVKQRSIQSWRNKSLPVTLIMTLMMRPNCQSLLKQEEQLWKCNSEYVLRNRGEFTKNQPLLHLHHPQSPQRRIIGPRHNEAGTRHIQM